MLYSHIFIDGSVNNQLKIGYGAYLVVSELGAAIESLKDTVRVKRFEHTNSTKLELQTLLWALSETVALGGGGDMVLTVYTEGAPALKKVIIFLVKIINLIIMSCTKNSID